MAESHRKEAKRLQHEIAQLEAIRDDLSRVIRAKNEHFVRLTGRSNLPPKSKEVVLRRELAPYIARWIELFENQYGTKGIYELANKCGMSLLTIRNILGLTEQGKTQVTVNLETADRLLTGMEMNHVLHELDIHVVEIGKSMSRQLPEPPFSHYEE